MLSIAVLTACKSVRIALLVVAITMGNPTCALRILLLTICMIAAISIAARPQATVIIVLPVAITVAETAAWLRIGAIAVA